MSKESSQSLILRQKRQQQQRSLSLIEVEEIMSPELDAQGGAGALLMGSPLATIPDCDNASPRPCIATPMIGTQTSHTPIGGLCFARCSGLRCFDQ